MRKAREWQVKGLEVVEVILNSSSRDVSIAAGVGSGKTYFSGTVLKFAKDIGRAEQIIVVTINRRCQRQWRKELKTHGVSLRILYGNGKLKKGLPADVTGYITTYAGMGLFPDLHAAFCGAKKTFVVFDEVHHLNEAENTTWGAAAKVAFDSAEFRMCLSGTFFSSNGAKIPFANMVPRQGSNDIFEYDPQVVYTYGDSVADSICRRAVFKPFDGPIEYRRENDSNYRVASFTDQIEMKDWGLRLWSACQAKGTQGQPHMMIEEMLFRAHRRLMDLRAAGDTRAGGLLVCNEKGQARAMRDLLEKITGHKAILVLDDESGSDDAIDSFEKGSTPWLVAVRMVTEGVDIPRFRVGVYLSNVVQLLTFLQFIGRLVREGETHGECYVYYPGDERLVEIAKSIEAEMNVAIDLREKKKKSKETEELKPGSAYQSGHVNGEEGDNIVAGEMFSASEIEVAESLRMQWPNLAETQIIDMVKFVRAAATQQANTAGPVYTRDAEEDAEDHDSVRRECQSEVGIIGKQHGLDYSDVHTLANRAIGIIDIDLATVEQLQAKRAWLREYKEALARG